MSLKKTILPLMLLTLLTSIPCEASWVDKIVKYIEKGNAINSNILARQVDSLVVQREIRDSQKDIESLMKQVNDSVTGHSGYGKYQYHDYGSYGDGARNWDKVLQMAGSGSGGGAFGQSVRNIANQFPSDASHYNQGVHEANSQKYYALQSQTIIATRAASQLDYDNIQDQIAYQQMLQQQIEKTDNLKAAVDLNNRLQVESNLINLAILRQSALNNQQQAVSAQATMNSALAHAKFLTKQ